MAKKRRGRRARNPRWQYADVGGGTTATMAIAASVVAAGLVGLVMQNRKNMALRACALLSGGA